MSSLLRARQARRRQHVHFGLRFGNGWTEPLKAQALARRLPQVSVLPCKRWWTTCIFTAAGRKLALSDTGGALENLSLSSPTRGSAFSTAFASVPNSMAWAIMAQRSSWRFPADPDSAPAPGTGKASGRSSLPSPTCTAHSGSAVAITLSNWTATAPPCPSLDCCKGGTTLAL